jgi:hypothetical protein
MNKIKQLLVLLIIPNVIGCRSVLLKTPAFDSTKSETELPDFFGKRYLINPEDKMEGLNGFLFEKNGKKKVPEQYYLFFVKSDHSGSVNVGRYFNETDLKNDIKKSDDYITFPSEGKKEKMSYTEIEDVFFLESQIYSILDFTKKKYGITLYDTEEMSIYDFSLKNIGNYFVLNVHKEHGWEIDIIEALPDGDLKWHQLDDKWIESTDFNLIRKNITKNKYGDANPDYVYNLNENDIKTLIFEGEELGYFDTNYLKLVEEKSLLYKLIDSWWVRIIAILFALIFINALIKQANWQAEENRLYSMYETKARLFNKHVSKYFDYPNYKDITHLYNITPESLKVRKEFLEGLIDIGRCSQFKARSELNKIYDDSLQLHREMMQAKRNYENH